MLTYCRNSVYLQIIKICLVYLCHDPNYNYDDDDDDSAMETEDDEDEEWVLVYCIKIVLRNTPVNYDPTFWVH